jgi:NADPH:quinone reductase
MRAVSVNSAGRFTLTDAPMPEPGPGQLRIQVELWSVSPSELAVFPQTTGLLNQTHIGSETCGFIDAVGPNTPGWHPGERVSFRASHGFSEYSVCPGNEAILLPRKLDSQPVPWGTFGAAMKLIEQARIGCGQTVAILGMGFLGALLTQLAACKGARVIALSRRSYGLALAHSMGASELVCLGAPEDALRQIDQWTEGNRCEVVVDASGRPQTRALSEALTGDSGRLLLPKPRTFPIAPINFKPRKLLGREILPGAPPDPLQQLGSMRAAVAALCKGELTPSRLFTHRFHLEDLESAVALAKQRPEGFTRALLQP